MPEEKELSRRRFLQYGGLMAGAAATLGVVRVSVAAEPDAPAAHGDAGAPLNRGWMFFANPQEFATLADAAERIFPQDESGHDRAYARQSLRPENRPGVLQKA